MASNTTSEFKIPAIYRGLFILLDIAMPVMGIAVNTLSPMMNLQNYTPKPTSPINLETYVLLDCTSGFFAALAFLNVYLLVYKPNDLVVWKGLVGAVLLQDLWMVGGFLREIRLRESAGGEVWNGQDFGNVGGYAAIALLRGVFVLGIGLGGRRGSPQLKTSRKEL